MASHEWHEHTDEGLRYWRARVHGDRWTIHTTLKSEDEWQPIDPIPRELWVELRELLWRKYQRNRCPWKYIEQIDRFLANDPAGP